MATSTVGRVLVVDKIISHVIGKLDKLDVLLGMLLRQSIPVCCPAISDSHVKERSGKPQPRVLSKPSLLQSKNPLMPLHLEKYLESTAGLGTDL